MTAQELLNITPQKPALTKIPVLPLSAPLADLLAALLDSPTGVVNITDGQKKAGSIDIATALHACSELIPRRQESSIITLHCAPRDYSASQIARAVEDAEAHLLDLYTMAAPGGLIAVQLRISRIDPAPVVRSLERYGFNVISTESNVNTDHSQALLRLQELQRYLDL